MGLMPPERHKVIGCKRVVDQLANPDTEPESMPILGMAELVEHYPEAWHRCGTLLECEYSDQFHHQVIEIQPITPLVIKQDLASPERSTAQRFLSFRMNFSFHREFTDTAGPDEDSHSQCTDIQEARHAEPNETALN
jgi:hypothetical protein